jgi:hypothetical protein
MGSADRGVDIFGGYSVHHTYLLLECQAIFHFHLFIGFSAASHMIISVDAEKLLDKVQHLFMIKMLSKLGVEGMSPYIIQTIYDTPNSILHDEN